MAFTPATACAGDSAGAIVGVPPPNSKGLALDLAFLRALNARIIYAPIRIPLVDHTPNSAQVTP